MREHLTRRLSDLRDELDNGQHLLNELDARRDELTRSMLRIGGAVQVLEEMLAPGNQNPALISSLDPASTVASPLRRVAG